MLDVEVVLVVEDGDELVGILRSASIDVAALGRDGDRGEINLLRHLEVGRGLVN